MKISMVFFALALVATEARAWGQPSKAEKEVLDRWQSLLARADESLAKQDHVAAEARAEELLADYDRHLEGGKNASQNYGGALVRRALARAGQGRIAEAAWDWDAARGFLGELAPAPFLPPAEATLEVPPKEAARAGENLATPRVSVAPPNPRYTHAARRKSLQGVVVIEIVVDVEGRPTKPKVLKSLDPGLDLQALEALRQGRFEPARQAGRPVPAYWVSTMNFAIR